MQVDCPLISICIPTNGVVKWVIPTLERLYAQGGDSGRFEVVVADNGDGDDLQSQISNLHYSNLRYFKSSSKGFLNQIFCFRQAKGDFIRMLNHRCLLADGALAHLLEVVDANVKERPLIFFSNKGLGHGQQIECPNFESFVSSLSYWSSWSGGVSFWREDLNALASINIDSMFPTSSILFEIRKESRYVIDDIFFQEPQDESGKGGYNLFRTFAVRFLDILSDLRLRGRISIPTFLKVKSELWPFLVRFYYVIKVEHFNYTFEMADIPQSLSVYYGRFAYALLRWDVYVKTPTIKLRDKIKRLLHL